MAGAPVESRKQEAHVQSSSRAGYNEVVASDYSSGEQCQVWSNSNNAWLTGTVSKAFTTNAIEDNYAVRAGTVKVRSESGLIKYIYPEHVATMLRKIDGPLVPGDADSFARPSTSPLPQTGTSTSSHIGRRSRGRTSSGVSSSEPASRPMTSATEGAPALGPLEELCPEFLEFAVGELIQVWSRSNEAWLDGTIKAMYSTVTRADGYTMAPGTIKVESQAGTKYIYAQSVKDSIRKHPAQHRSDAGDGHGMLDAAMVRAPVPRKTMGGSVDALAHTERKSSRSAAAGAGTESELGHNRGEEAAAKEAELSHREEEVAAKEAELGHREEEVAAKEAELSHREEEVAAKDAELGHREKEALAKEVELDRRAEEVDAKELELRRRAELIAAKEAEMQRVDMIALQDAERKASLGGEALAADVDTKHKMDEIPSRETEQPQRAHQALAMEADLKKRAGDISARAEQVQKLAEEVAATYAELETSQRLAEEIAVREAELQRLAEEVVAIYAEVKGSQGTLSTDMHGEEAGAREVELNTVTEDAAAREDKLRELIEEAAEAELQRGAEEVAANDAELRRAEISECTPATGDEAVVKDVDLKMREDAAVAKEAELQTRAEEAIATEAQLQVREEHLAASKADMQRLGEELATKEGAIEASLAALREETIAKEMELKRREDEIAVKEGELKSRAEDASAREEVLQLRAEEVELEKGIAEEVQPVPRGTSPPPPLPRGGKEYGEGDEEAQEVKALPPPEDGAHSASPRLEPPPDTTQPLQEEKGSLDLTLDLDYGRTDLAAFKSDLIEILLKSRADPSILDRIQIDFREGSIVAELRGPFDDMFALRPLLLQSAAAAEHGPAQVDQNPEQVDVNPSLHEDSSQPRTAPSEGAVLTSEHPSLQEEASRPRTAPSEGTVLASEHPSLQEEASRPRTAPNEGAVGNVEQWDAGLSLAASTTNQGLRRRADARWWWHAAPLKIEDKQAADLCYTAGIQAAHQLWDVRAAEIGVKPSLHWRVREAEEVRQKLSDVLSQLNEDSKPASPSGMSPRTPARRGLQKEKTMLPSAAAHRGRVERCEAELTMLVKQASSRNAHAPLKRAHSTGSIARASHDVGGFGFSPLLGAERTWKAFGSAPLADALANGPPTGTPVGGDPAVRTVPITDLVGWKPGASSKAFRDGNGKFSDAHWMPSIASQTGKKSKPGFSGTSRGRG